MIIMYKRTIGYSNVCKSMQGHRIKFKLQSQVFGYDILRSKHKGNHFDTQDKMRIKP